MPDRSSPASTGESSAPLLAQKKACRFYNGQAFRAQER
ncbi:hypothetical protein AB28_1665 [Raoultella ornithinolytica 2-156-04_S1_C2]|nr:hypothetical protein AB28_1665 [Raoultella ornithinolytica 2-156-04_S1_C2]